jgi:hypothetical protein
MTDKRKPDGTFAPGNEGGPGRPKRQTESAYMAVVMSQCPLEVWGEIVGKAVTDAKAGDRHAREWLARYLVGEPSPNWHAPKPSRVLAQEELGGEDEIEDEKARIKLNQFMSGVGF